MSTKILLTFKSPDSNTPLADARVELRDASRFIRGITYTDANGLVTFGMPAATVTDINDRVINPRKGMYCRVEGVGETGNFDVPAVGTFEGTIVFNGQVSEMASSLVVDSLPQGTVTITGTPTSGEVLTASNDLTDADGIGTISYRWKADGVNIVGATASTFTLTGSQVGKAITVSASYTDAKGTVETVTSEPTALVAAA